MIKKPIALLFDLDGVIVDSEDAWFFSLNATLKYFNKNQISKEIFNEKYWGNDVNDTLIKLDLPNEAVKIVNNVYLDNINNVKIFPDTIDTLFKLEKYKKGLITNTPKKSALSLLKKFNILRYFNIVVTSDDVKFGKPNPEIIEKACKLLNVKPFDVVIIGDTISDVKAAKSIGSTVIGIKIDADYSINKLSEILNLLNI